MLCYKDMTFCSYSDCERFSYCCRALTDRVHEDAEKWWKNGRDDITSNPPICVFSAKPSCYQNHTGQGCYCLVCDWETEQDGIAECPECGERAVPGDYDPMTDDSEPSSAGLDNI